MNKSLTHWIRSINAIGFDTDKSALENRIKAFFNQITLIGGIASFAQFVMFFQIDIYCSIFMLVASLSCFVALYFHKLNWFTLARVSSFVIVLSFGSMCAMRMGNEYIFHLSSITVVIAILITFSKKEWRFVLFLMLLELATVLIVESNYFKVDNFSIIEVQVFRSITLIGTILFVLYEVLFAVRLSEQNENKNEFELREANKILTAKNDEITLMMREIHHRVKNNLQIIVSLLRLKANEIKDDNSQELFDSTIERIQAMSILHKKIYQSENIAKLDIKDYLESLTDSLVKSYLVDKKINLEVSSNIDQLKNKHIVPFALILNELITNSLVHAFDDKSTGEITVIAQEKEGKVILEYKDSGIWKPQIKEDSFGLSLIDMLTDQLSGNFELKKENTGSAYRFEFNELLY